MDNTHTGPRDVFLQILNTILIYVGIFAFGSLLFQIINISFPDPLLNYLGSESLRYAALRWPISFLVIVFPAFVWLSYYIANDIEKHPAKKDLKTRRWLIHFTLFASALAILIDLITLVYRFLGGEFTTPFLLKVLVVFFMATSIFAYYRWVLKHSTPALKDKQMRIFVVTVLLIIAGSIIYGFVLMGSPFAERARRLDLERISSLDSIQWQIINYWQNKEVLPNNLAELENPLSGYAVPVDPETRDSFEYTKTGDLIFELCANFQTSNLEDREANNYSRYLPQQNWLHDAGRNCFERTIDPDVYPPRDTAVIKPTPVF